MELTREEKDILIELISNKQIKHMIAKDKYDTDDLIRCINKNAAVIDKL